MKIERGSDVLLQSSSIPALLDTFICANVLLTPCKTTATPSMCQTLNKVQIQASYHCIQIITLLCICKKGHFTPSVL